MALTYVGGVVGNSNVSNTTYSIPLTGMLTGGIDTSPSPGDIIVVFIAEVATSDLRLNMSVSGDNSGTYTEEASAFSNDTRDALSKVFYSIQGATVDSALSVFKASDTAHGGVTLVQVWRGIDSSTPIDVATVTTTGANGNNADPGGITPVTDGAVIIYGGFGTQVAGNTSLPTDTNSEPIYNTEARSGSTRRVAGYVAAHTSWISGAYNPNASTGMDSTSNESWTAHTLVLRPGAAPQLTKTQPAVARIATNPTTTQPATASIQQTVTKIQSAIAAISQTNETDQPAVAQIANDFIFEQPALAAIGQTITTEQTATAQVAVNRTMDQTATARVNGVSIATQQATARIASDYTLDQTATAYVTRAIDYTKTQPAVARIANDYFIEQTSQARIVANFQKTQQAISRISSSRTFTQNSISRVASVVVRIQTAVAALGGTATATQTATARIIRTTVKVRRTPIILVADSKRSVVDLSNPDKKVIL